MKIYLYYIGKARDTHANAMAALLETGLRALPGVTFPDSRQANAVFATLPPALAAALREKGWLFYNDVDPGRAARLMCSWDTASEDVAAFLRDAAEMRP